MGNKDLLWVIWTYREENLKYVVGKLYRQGKYFFEYCKDGLKNAKTKGFNGLFCFPDENKIYESDTLFNIFSTRLPSRNRHDILEILNEYGLEEYEGFELLKKTKGRSMTDNLEFLTEADLPKTKEGKAANRGRIL